MKLYVKKETFEITAFSEREEAILKILGRRRMTYKQIAEELKELEMNPVFDLEIAVGNCVRRIMKKCEADKHPFQLVKKKVSGKLTVWRISV